MAKVFADDITLTYAGTGPYLILNAMTVYDTLFNSNSRIDPGETAPLTATFTNAGNADLNNLATTITSSDPYITISDNVGYFGFLGADSTKENSDDPYVVRADSNTPSGHIADFMLVAADSEFADTFTFTLQVGSYNFLVWNPDPTPSSGFAIDSILKTLGYSGVCNTMLPSIDANSYHAVFVCTGVYPNRYKISDTSAAASALVSYLNDGGRMYLEGGDVWYWDPMYGGYDFGPLFGITPVSDGLDDMGPIAGESETFTEGMYFDYNGENDFMDRIAATGAGFPILKHADSLYTCGVAHDAGIYRTVGTSLELGGLVDASGVSTRAALLDSIMHFFGIFTIGVKETSTYNAVRPVLMTFPNPFSKTLWISYGIDPKSSNSVGLEIYDVAGRLVKSFNLQSEISRFQCTMPWNGCDSHGNPVPAGVYFCCLTARGTTVSQKIIRLVP